MELKSFRKFMRGRRFADIVACEAHSLDIERWYIYVKFRDGRELRLATSSGEETREDCRQIDEWRRIEAEGGVPEDFEPVVDDAPARRLRRLALGWLTFWLVVVVLAWYGAVYTWLLDGWVYTRHFVAGMFASIALTVTMLRMLAPQRFELNMLLPVFPLLFLMTATLTIAAKGFNAVIGRQHEIRIEGPIVDLDQDTQTLVMRRSTVEVHETVLTVVDAKTGKRFEIELPATIAERERPMRGAIWRDRFWSGSLGWNYRRVDNWDEPDTARVVAR